jgi:asparagine synthase (glutamine-hydrolysing)
VSGIVGIYQRNGAPVDRGLLSSLTRFLSFRGPDAKETWSHGPIGLGQTMLRTTAASRNERQPASLDGLSWIVADVRLDCRDELKSQLRSARQEMQSFATDPELLLHAYSAWGEDCMQWIRGDFAFAIWDAERRALFCARDHFGVKPFYYAETDNLFLFSNTLNCVRLHADVSEELNEEAIADFLLFGLNCDVATTTFRDVHRLPPAHCATVSADSVRLRRYWSVPVDGRIRYARSEDYAEHFRQVLRVAVADRMGPGTTGIFLSGGMDSGAIAATAREITGDSRNLAAYTATLEALIQDREGSFAKQTADFLRIPLRLIPMDDLQPFDRWDDPNFASLEPTDNPLFAISRRQFEVAAQHSRVVLDGEGGDNLMYFEMGPYSRDLARRAQWGDLASSVSGYLWRKRSRWHRLGARAQRKLSSFRQAALPPWITPDFARRVNLEERTGYRRSSRSRVHPILPRAHASMDLPHWPKLFETSDPGFTRQPVEARFPFLDLRVVEYLLALPPYPWLLEKRVTRDSMSGRLPGEILCRPKTPLVADPMTSVFRKNLDDWVDRLDWSGAIGRYVDAKGLRSVRKNTDALGSPEICALCLNFWLQSAGTVRYNLMAEVRNA